MNTISFETRLQLVATVAAGLRANPNGHVKAMSSLDVAEQASLDVDLILTVEKVRVQESTEESYTMD